MSKITLRYNLFFSEQDIGIEKNTLNCKALGELPLSITISFKE